MFAITGFILCVILVFYDLKHGRRLYDKQAERFASIFKKIISLQEFTRNF
jgi:hypothetical protein